MVKGYKECEYCGQEIASSSYKHHVEGCEETPSAICGVCGKQVKIPIMDTHTRINHPFDEKQKEETEKPKLTIVNPMDMQEGGNHYKKYEIQPIEFIIKNNIGYVEGNIIKYILRFKDKNGLEDLKKARHYIDILINNHH